MYKTGSRQENLHNDLRTCKVEKYIKRVEGRVQLLIMMKQQGVCFFQKFWSIPLIKAYERYNHISTRRQDWLL